MRTGAIGQFAANLLVGFGLVVGVHRVLVVVLVVVVGSVVRTRSFAFATFDGSSRTFRRTTDKVRNMIIQPLDIQKYFGTMRTGQVCSVGGGSSFPVGFGGRSFLLLVVGCGTVWHIVIRVGILVGIVIIVVLLQRVRVLVGWFPHIISVVVLVGVCVASFGCDMLLLLIFLLFWLL